MPRLTSFGIKNFKSLADFSLELASQSPLTCLVGLNGAGKSTVLQAIDFVGQLFRGDLTGWLHNRGWKSSDLTHKPALRRSIDLTVICELADKRIAEWTASFNTSKLRCTDESLVIEHETIYHLKDKTLKTKYDADEKKTPAFRVGFQYQGSILSQLDEDFISKNLGSIQDILRFFQGIHSFDLLSPHLLRSRAREGENLGIGGEKLSAYVHSLPTNELRGINETLRSFYPNLRSIGSRSLRSGWKSLYMTERLLGTPSLETEARHMNDGALRLIAILSEMHSADTLILFDEIENGFNPALVERLVQIIVNSALQIVVTTHSPLILNYLDDDTAIDATALIYRDRNGATHAKRFFDLPEAQERLPHMTPGEVFLDVDIEQALKDLSSASAPKDDPHDFDPEDL